MWGGGEGALGLPEEGLEARAQVRMFDIQGSAAARRKGALCVSAGIGEATSPSEARGPRPTWVVEGNTGPPGPREGAGAGEREGRDGARDGQGRAGVQRERGDGGVVYRGVL